MTEFVKFPRSPIAYDGWPIIAAGIVAALLPWYFISSGDEEMSTVSVVLKGISFLSVLFVFFSIWFFRDPVRTADSTDSRDVLTGADGTVLKVESVNDPRYGEPAQKISIFMSPINVHVNRSPIAGVVEKVEYVHGKFFNASLDKASLGNERNLVIVKGDNGVRIGFLQIAGFIARRIVCNVKVGDRLQAGQRYGMIRFGSRMEIFVPASSQVLVKPGQVIAAGKTVVARTS